jgi:hypothetical protein
MENICKTDFGTFRVKVDKQNINVGGKNFCVNIVLQEKETSLYWLKTDEGGCEITGKDIRKENTIKMVDLAFSLLRKYYPDRKIVTLLDDSGFSWRDKKGKNYKTNFLKGYLLLHRKTWYEEKFGATMYNDEEYAKYREKADNNYDSQSRKPDSFDFINPESKEKLDPLYKSSRTWGEFIDKLISTYDNEKYKLIYDWYRKAIYYIFDEMEINQYWKIDVSTRPYIECITNGGGKTRKRRRITFSKYHKLEPFVYSPLWA